MGNREKLLDGAVLCLRERGYLRTTARDVASAAGVSLAAIGYHFGTTEALLTQALHRAVEEWGAQLEQAMAGRDDDPADPAERFAAVWDRIVATVAEQRALWTTQLEVITQLDRTPQLRELLQGSQEQGRLGLVALFQGALGAEAADVAAGTLYQALLTGVVVQHLVDPSTAPAGKDLLAGLRAVSAAVLGRAGAPLQP
jgi:AcrR family transcriptional regulator